MPRALVSYDLMPNADSNVASNALRKAGYKDGWSEANRAKQLPTTTFVKECSEMATATTVVLDVINTLKAAKTPAAKVTALVRDDLAVWP